MYFDKEKLETRCLPTSEVRIVGDEKTPRIEGYAAVFNVWADIGGWFKESIKPGAFRKTIKEADVRALWNHNPDYVLGRNKSNTLRLSEDSKGLAYEITPPNTSWARDLMESMRRLDVSQSSFGFTVNKQQIDYERDERVLEDVTLFDVSVVTYPAYPTTSAEVRSAFANKGGKNTSDTSSTGSITFTYIPPEPPGFSELDRIVRKIKAKEELTEEEVRLVSAYLPNLSVPPAQHTETPPEPPAQHSAGDIRKGSVADLLIRAARTVGQPLRKEEST